MANMHFKADLLPSTDLGYSLGSSNERWKIYGIMESGLEVKGHIAGDSGTTGHGLYSGGGYHNAYNNIILHGDATTGTSGIAFVSDKGDTTINQPSDRAFIQWHAMGVTTYTAEGTAPTLATTGENNVLMIGVGNDATDQVRIQTPGRTGLLHQVASAGYVIPDTNNTTGTVGSGTQPVWVDGGVIKNTTYTLGKSVPSDAAFTDTNKYHKTGSWSGLTYTATAVNNADELKFTVPSATTSAAGAMAMSETNLNTMINQLSTGTTTPIDADYYISQYVGGGTSNTTYHRRPMSALYEYVKNKLAVTNNNVNLSRNTETTIATIGGTAIKIKLPASDNTDTKQNITLAATSKAFLTGVTTTPTSTAQALTGIADTGVYLTATAGEVSAVRHSFNSSGTEKAYITFNTATNALDFIFA